MTTLGIKLDQSAVARIENNGRGVSLEEALAFAVALGVQPAALIAPSDSALELVPNQQRWVGSEAVWEWFAGRRAIGPMQAPYARIEDAIPEFVQHENATNTSYYQSVSDDEAEAIRLMPGIHDLFVSVCELKGSVRAFVRQGDPAGILPIIHGQLSGLQEDVRTELKKVERKMTSNNLKSVPRQRVLRHPAHREKGN